MLTERSDLEHASKYLKRLVGRIGKVNTSADRVLYDEGVSKLMVSKYASLHDGNQPPCLDNILKGPQFKVPNNAVLFPYFSNYELTHIAVAGRGGMQLYPITERAGAFLADDLDRTVYVCRTEVDALILRHLGVSATVLTAPSALTYDYFNIILVDSKGAPLRMGDVLEYKKLYQNVTVCSVPNAIFDYRTNHPQLALKTFETSTMSIHKWFALKVSVGYVRSQRRLTNDLEDSEISKEDLELVKAELKQIPNTAMIIDWLSRVELTTKSSTVNGIKIIQNKDGWRFAGSDKMLTNFHLIINNIIDVKGVQMLNCQVVVAGCGTYRMTVPSKSLHGSSPISNLILDNFQDITTSPKLDCRSIPHPDISWLVLSNALHQYNRVTVNTTKIGFDDFVVLYNQIFSGTSYKRPQSTSFYNKHGDKTLGYWHSITGALWLSQARLLLAIKDLTGNKSIGRKDLDACFSPHVERVKTSRGDFFVFPSDMLKVVGEGKHEIVEFAAV